MFARTLLLGACALLTTVTAQSEVLSFTRVPNPITDGEPAAILYATNDTQTPVTILLRQGPSSNLQTIETLTTSSVGGQFIWTPPLSLPNGQDYALEIRQAGQNNYYGPFTVQGASPDAVASASSAAQSSSSSSVTGSVTTQAANATASSNSTMTMTGLTSAGTGTSMSRNATMSSATLTSSMSMTSDASSTTGAGFEGTSTGSGAGASETGNVATSTLTGGSTLAFALGALAAVLFVQ